VQLPAGALTGSSLLHLKASLAASAVVVQLGCLRKGYEFLLQACDALWLGVQQAVRKQQAVQAGREGGSKRARLTHVDQLWRQAGSAAEVQVGARAGSMVHSCSAGY
jgi:hypothetical protein